MHMYTTTHTSQWQNASRISLVQLSKQPSWCLLCWWCQYQSDCEPLVVHYTMELPDAETICEVECILLCPQHQLWSTALEDHAGHTLECGRARWLRHRCHRRRHTVYPSFTASRTCAGIQRSASSNTVDCRVVIKTSVSWWILIQFQSSSSFATRPKTVA